MAQAQAKDARISPREISLCTPACTGRSSRCPRCSDRTCTAPRLPRSRHPERIEWTASSSLQSLVWRDGVVHQGTLGADLVHPSLWKSPKPGPAERRGVLSTSKQSHRCIGRFDHETCQMCFDGVRCGARSSPALKTGILIVPQESDLTTVSGFPQGYQNSVRTNRALALHTCSASIHIRLDPASRTLRYFGQACRRRWLAGTITSCHLPRIDSTDRSRSVCHMSS
ncbi:hypothetical protein LCGC14_1505400 [marine sediment metagenome]|uniref:Uncharacterized protein n=1 Tax=marine sediment metagenome TaxID=412755 RepID=A0A0F9J3A8_9ZZZZ